MRVQPDPSLPSPTEVPTACSASRRSRDLSEFFCGTVLREMLARGESPRFARLARSTRLAESFDEGVSVGEVFDRIFATLCQAQDRYDYVYRAVLTRNLFLKRHSLRTATILSEFRAGESKADVVILNGCSTAYEIKSDRDSLARLDKQLEDYRRVFARVFVVCGERHVRALVDQVPAGVGILRVSRSVGISTIREAEDARDRLDPSTILQSLRVVEATEILKRLDVEVPPVPNTLLRSELTRLFLKLDPTLLHGAMVATLKRSRSTEKLHTFLKDAPTSWHSALLVSSAQPKEQVHFLSAVRSPLKSALEWC